MLEQIEQIARKYDIDSLSGRIEDIRNTASIKIAFLGEFSAGKSSLINSILGTHLPTDILPTTKAICLIEPTEGITGNKYFKESDGIRTDISFGEFSEILTGEKEEVAGLLIAPSKVLPMGSIFIDTPGFHTAVGKEAEQTFSYLSMIDAAVLCINIADGVINASVMDFLTDQVFSMIQNHIVFALTGSDKKSPAARERIRESIIKQLEKAVSEGKLSIDNIPEKVFTVSAKDEGNAEKVYGVLEKAILKDHAKICAQRQEADMKKIAEDLNCILREMLKMTTFDTGEIDEEIREQKRKRDEITGLIRKREDALEEFTCSLRSKIAAHMRSHLANIQLMRSNEEKSACIQEMNSSLFEMLNSEARSYLKIAELPPVFTGMVPTEILGRLNTIERIKDIGVTVSTSIITAWAMPAAGVAGNLFEAGAGALIGNATKLIGKAVAGGGSANRQNTARSYEDSSFDDSGAEDDDSFDTDAMFTDVDDVCDSGVDMGIDDGESFNTDGIFEDDDGFSSGSDEFGSDTTMEPDEIKPAPIVGSGRASRFFGKVGKVMQDINAFEKVGSIVSFYVGKNVLENMVDEKSAAIALQVTATLEEPYQNDVLAPLLNQLREEEKILKSIRRKGDKAFEDFKARQAEIKSDIATLQKLA